MLIGTRRIRLSLVCVCAATPCLLCVFKTKTLPQAIKSESNRSAQTFRKQAKASKLLGNVTAETLFSVSRGVFFFLIRCVFMNDSLLTTNQLLTSLARRQTCLTSALLVKGAATFFVIVRLLQASTS